MTNARLSRKAGWSALASAIVTILSLVTLIMFFTLGQPWGTINDITTIVQALSMLPVLLVLHRLHRHDAPIIGLATFVIGALSMLIVGVFQTLLVVKVIVFAQTAIIVPAAFGLLGISLVFYGYRAHINETMPRRMVVLSIIAGASYVVSIAGYLIGGEQHPLTALGGLAAVIFYPIWAISLGRLLLSGVDSTHKCNFAGC